MSHSATRDATSLSATGAPGLDEILGGGLTPQRLYLIEGAPGSGKTTLAVQYLLEGARQGEKGMYIALSESRAELLAAARSHGWSMAGVDILELTATEQDLDPENQYTLFQPAEMEMNATTKMILAEIDRAKPKRVVVDSLSEVRLLAQNALRYRRQVLALKQFFAGRECTVLLLDDKTSDPTDLQLQSIAHGVLSLEQMSPGYGGTRRRLRITKLRGQRFQGGYHDFAIHTGGLVVYPRLVAADHPMRRRIEALPGEVKELDAMLGGGVDAGTSVLLVGPAGAGKSSVAVNYAYAAANRGERSALFIFDERPETLLMRMAGLGMDLDRHLESGLITLQAVDPAELSPGELTGAVCQAVEGRDGHPPARMIVIDSLNGFLHSMPEEQYLTAQLHELLTYLGRRGVTTFLVLAQHGLVGSMHSPVDTTYLADTVILFRYFEAAGQVRQALSVVKRRCGKHERTIRELRLDGRIEVGPPLTEFQGVLTGVPTFQGNAKALLGPSP